jgi:ligand-binding sensor domain-containing protein
LLSICLFLFPAGMAALDPHTRISQYGHTAWRAQDGFVSNPNAITQTTDGYIWIATNDGLFRFDGVKFRRRTPPNDQSLPGGGTFNCVLGARDGSL